MQSQSNPSSPAPASPPISTVGNEIVQLLSSTNTESIVADIQTALNLFLQFKASLNGLHPTALSVIKFLL